VLAHLSRE
jgi:hypothetical protein